MKTKLVSVLTAGGMGLALLLTACDDASTRSDDRTLGEATKDRVGQAAAATKEAARDVKEASVEAWNSFSSYTVEKKDDAVAFLERQADELDEEIAELREDASELSDEAGDRWEAGLAELEEKRAELAEQIREAREATGESWTEVKQETREKWIELKEYVRELRAEISAS